MLPLIMFPPFISKKFECFISVNKIKMTTLQEKPFDEKEVSTEIKNILDSADIK